MPESAKCPKGAVGLSAETLGNEKQVLRLTIHPLYVYLRLAEQGGAIDMAPRGSMITSAHAMTHRPREILRAIPAIDYVWICTLTTQTMVATVVASASTFGADVDSAAAIWILRVLAVVSLAVCVMAIRAAWRDALAKLAGETTGASVLQPASAQAQAEDDRRINRTAFWAATGVTIYMVLGIEQHVPSNPALGSLLLLAFYAASLWLIRSGMLNRLLARLAR